MRLESEKRVHLSIDDVCRSLRWLTYNQPDSLFDMRLFGRLRQWNRHYGAKFTLYCFAMMDNFLLSEIPMRYVDEFCDSAGWLRFGYHGKSASRFSEDRGYRAGYELFSHTAKQLGMQTSSILRLHNWLAEDEQKDFLYNKGIQVLLYPDDSNQPYMEDDSFEDRGLQHWRTRIRFEYLDRISESTLHIGLNRIVAFTHEQVFEQESEKMEAAIQLFREKQYEFI